MNTIITSKEAILAQCIALAMQEGLQALNMRAVAGKCGVAVGSVYNYFPSKADLIAETVQAVWQDVFHSDNCAVAEYFPLHIEWIFASVKVAGAKYPNFFGEHSMSFTGDEKVKARQVMQGYFVHMKDKMKMALQADKTVSAEAFSETFTADDFVNFVFAALITELVQGEDTCDTLTEIVKRVIY